jgi:hypothetical protein
MSPPVMTLPARNFKFLNEGSLERTRNYRPCEKNFRGLPSETGFPSAFLRWCPFGFQLPLVAGAIEPPLHSRQTKLNHCPVTGWRHFLSARLWSCSGRSPRSGGNSQQGADHAEAEPSPLLVGDQQVRKLADIAFFIF